jgi:hypothetical protein
MSSESSSSTVQSVENALSNAADSLRQMVPAYVDPDEHSHPENRFETIADYVLGTGFLVLSFIALKRMLGNRQHTPGAETTVVTAFYSLIFVTAALRCVYFVIPNRFWQPSYTPVAVYAWDDAHPSWMGYTLAEFVVTAGSLTLFSIFILILVYWADILKKYYNPGSRRTLPMATFLVLVLTLLIFEVTNLALFLLNFYTTEGMILFDSVLLAVTSMICVAEITIFSQKFQNVLKTLGAINQVSTDSQVRRIVWITVTGNLFFLIRATLETVFAVSLLVYWCKNGTVNRAFSHAWWDAYTITKYGSELTILALMLHILQSRFATTAASTAVTASQSNSAGYTKVPDSEKKQLQSMNV